MRWARLWIFTVMLVSCLGVAWPVRYGEYWVEVMGPGGVMLGFEAAPGSKAEAKDGIIIGLGVSDHGASVGAMARPVLGRVKVACWRGMSVQWRCGTVAWVVHRPECEWVVS